MKPIRAALALFFAAPGVALASPTLEAHDLAIGGTGAGVAAKRFELVGLHWQGGGSVRFRTQAATGRWRSWQVAAAEPDDLPDANTPEGRRSRKWHVGSPYWVGPSERIQYRVTGNVRRLRGFFVRSDTAPAAPRRAVPFEANAPGIITRAQWGANEQIRRNRKQGPLIADEVHLAIVHHTAGSNSYSRSQSAAVVRAVELYHVRGNGWDDIGYNFLVDKYGQIFEGRYGGMEKAVVGAHALGFNYGSVGVALIGNYNGAGLSAAARSALVKLLAWRLDVAHVDPLSRVTRISTGNPRYGRGRSVQLRAVSGHRDAYPTSCPGSSVYSLLPAIAREVGATGLPKIYAPLVFGAVGGNVRFTAKLSGSVPWNVTVMDALGHEVASGAGTGRSVDWTWDSSIAPRGRYTYSIDATSAGASARPVLGTLGRSVPQLSLTQLRVQPGVVSPNGDGFADVATITYVLGASAQLTVSLADAVGNPLATLFAGPMTQGPHSFAWRDVMVSDGLYRLTITARAASGKQVSGTASFYVDRTLAQVRAAPSVISPNGDGRADETALSFRLFAAAAVTVEVRRAGKRIATLLRQTFPVGGVGSTWNGKLGARVAPDGRYDLVVKATDTITTVIQKATVTVDTTAPKLRLASRARLQFWISERATVSAVFGGRRVSRNVRRGYFSFPAFRKSRHFTISATDPVGNAGRPLRG
jgi:hypothetical protein